MCFWNVKQTWPVTQPAGILLENGAVRISTELEECATQTTPKAYGSSYAQFEETVQTQRFHGKHFFWTKFLRLKILKLRIPLVSRSHCRTVRSRCAGWYLQKILNATISPDADHQKGVLVRRAFCLCQRIMHKSQVEILSPQKHSF